LNAALRKQFAYPQSGPPWLLPSFAGKPELPLGEEYGQYLDRTNGNNPQASKTPAAALDFTAGGNDIDRWVASLAGIDRMNPTRPAPQ
jgi:hypothetical protein